MTPVVAVAVSCAESVLMSPELAYQAAFAQPAQQRTTPVLKSLADKARERRHAVLALQGGLTVVQEEGAPNGPAVRTSPPRVRPHRRTALPALRLPSSNMRAYANQQTAAPQSASLPPSPPDSPSVYNWTLPSPGIVSPLSAYSHLTPSSLSRAPWTEIVFPADLAAENGRRSPTDFDGDDTSEEGACTTPTSMTEFGSVQDKDNNGGYLALVIPKIEVLPVPHRRAPLPPTVVLNGKTVPSGAAARGSSAGVQTITGRRRSSLPTLEQITARMAAKDGGKPGLARRSTAPDLTMPAPGSKANTASTTSRLPSFLLARGAKAQATENAKPAVSAPVVAEKPAFEVPVFTVTPPQERGEGGRRVLAVLNRRASGGAPKVVVHEPTKVWV